MRKILCVVGTRPEAIKMAPVIQALKQDSRASVHLVATAQHRELLDQVLPLFGIEADVDLDLMQDNQTLGELSARLLESLDRVLAEEQPDVVIAQGDTTTHGLVRGPSRYRIVAVIDPTCSGADAGEILDGVHRSIPVHASIDALLAAGGARPDVCIVGVATEGGVLPLDLRADLVAAARAQLSLVNGLHQFLGDDIELRRLTEERGTDIIDIRRPRPVQDLAFWSGKTLGLRTPRVAVLGTD